MSERHFPHDLTDQPDPSHGRPDRRRGRRRPRRRLLAALLAVALVAGVGAAVVLRQRAAEARDEREARAFATRFAAALSEGTLPEGVTASDGTVPDLAPVLDGMGELRHEVRVTRFERSEGRASATLAHRWPIHADKAPWQYDTTLAMRLRGGRWTATYEPGVLAPDLRPGEGLRAVRRTAERGDILGGDGEPVVTERPVVRLGIDRSAVPDDTVAARSARAVARIVDVDPKVYVAAVQGAGDRAFVEAITLRQNLPDTEATVSRVEQVTGGSVVEDAVPLAPTSAFARPLLGSVGQATAEVVEKSKGQVRAGDVVGLSGLQASHNSTLAGRAGYAVEAVALDSKAVRTITEVPAKDGEPLRTTLSSRHQLAAEDTLEDVRPASAVVAIRPSDGHVLAAASGPGGKGYSTATLGQYAPGSTFKAVTALALLRAGVDQDTRVECTATRVVDGRSFKNYDNYPETQLGRIPFRSAFAHSCNTALMAQAGRLERDGLTQAAAALGLTADPALGVPGALGSVPAAAPGVDLAASMIGQGKVLSTPVGMATVAASIAKGAAVSPVLVLDDEPRAGVKAPRPLQRAEAAQLRDLMRAVVTEGSASRLRAVPGADVLAKTGTAEYGNDTPPRTHAWMIGIQGDLAVAVFVEDGPGGSSTAGPLLEEFLTRLAS